MEVRPIELDRDLRALLGVLERSDSAVYGATDWTLDELRGDLEPIDLEHDSWLVLDNAGVVLGGGWILERGGRGPIIGDAYVDPGARGRGVGSTLVRAIVDRAREHVAQGAPHDGPARVHLAHLVGDPTAPALFTEHGFSRERSFFRMVIDLAGAAAQPVWPVGVEVRTLDPVRDAEALHHAEHQAFAAEWGYTPRPLAEWAELRLAGRGFDPSLAVVAWNGDEVAGFSLNYAKRAGDWGWIGMIGVVSAWRGKGLGMALLTESFSRFRATGETTAALGVDAANPTGATRLYERAGMRVLWQADVWERVLD